MDNNNIDVLYKYKQIIRGEIMKKNWYFILFCVLVLGLSLLMYLAVQEVENEGSNILEDGEYLFELVGKYKINVGKVEMIGKGLTTSTEVRSKGVLRVSVGEQVRLYVIDLMNEEYDIMQIREDNVALLETDYKVCIEGKIIENQGVNCRTHAKIGGIYYTMREYDNTSEVDYIEGEWLSDVYKPLTIKQ